MTQQTAIGRDRTAVRHEKETQPIRQFLSSAQKRFAKTLRLGSPVQAVIVMGLMAALTCTRLPGGLYPMATAAFTACLLHARSVPAAFAGCSVLVNIDIPESVTKIGGSAFSRCERLRSVIIPEGVATIESWMFSDCYGLESVTIPVSVTKIEDNVFYHGFLSFCFMIISTYPNCFYYYNSNSSRPQFGNACFTNSSLSISRK